MRQHLRAGTNSVAEMSNIGDKTSSGSKIERRAAERRVWSWGLGVTVLTVALLWGGTEAVQEFDQDVDWYTGFGQWLGALGSLLAAGAALWIATTDRRRIDHQRREDQAAQDTDLAREAGLVRVAMFDKRLPRSLKPSDAAPGISVTNWRSSPLFDLRLERIVVKGTKLLTPGIGFVEVPNPAENDKMSTGRNAEMLAREIIDSRSIVSIFPEDSTKERRKPETPELHDEKVECAVLRYTDNTGRRWEITSGSTMARRVH